MIFLVDISQNINIIRNLNMVSLPVAHPQLTLQQLNQKNIDHYIINAHVPHKSILYKKFHPIKQKNNVPYNIH